MARVRLNYFQCKYGYMIYLDIDDGSRKRSSTGLIVSKNYAAPIRKASGEISKDKFGKTKYPKIESKDKEAMEIAEMIATKTRNELNMLESEFPDKKKLNANFIEFFEKICKEKNNRSYDGALHNLKLYAGEKLAFRSIDYAFLSRFQKAMSAKVKSGTVNTYIQRMHIAWNEGMRLGYSKENPFNQVHNLKVAEEKLRYLELAELEALMNCKTKVNLMTRKAFVFSCFTGLRIGQIKVLKWDEVKGDYLEFRVQKGKVKILKVPLHETAKEILSTLDRSKKNVFHGLQSHSHINTTLKVWAKDAGIDKLISFHYSRHTMATLSVHIGIDVYTVKELLGHSSIKHTMVYASILDSKKSEAINKLPALKFAKLKRI